MNKNMDKNMIIFFDFDNTITTIDVIDDMLERFSGDEQWKGLEKRWQSEEIGSLECLKGQVEGINITKDRMDEYLDTVSIDPYFKKLLRIFKSRDISVLIVSDNFDYMLNGILARNNISGVEVYCNKVSFVNGRLKPSFPYSNPDCGACANCKKTHLLSKKKAGVKTVYVGDGKSDLCASKVSDMVFAKGYLKDIFRKEGLPHVAIDDLKGVYDYFSS